MSSEDTERTPLISPPPQDSSRSPEAPSTPTMPVMPLTTTDIIDSSSQNQHFHSGNENHDLNEDKGVLVYDVSIMDPESSTPIIFQDDSPVMMLWKDLWILIRNSNTLFQILKPMPKPGKDITNKGLFLQVVLVVGSIVLTIICLTSFFIGLPPPIIGSLMLFSWIWGFNTWAGKERITYQNLPGADKDDKEVWLFVNGIGTSKSGLKLILDAFYKLFGRRVIGVHNRTFGIWFDLVECMLQRDLLWNTTDTREGYNIISRYIADGTKEKIVLIAHSQGGIIMSSWVDQLLSDFSYDQLNKVEIYTFASAANHFSIPETESGPAFGNVEHFVNEWDYVSDIGLLSFAPPPPADLKVNASTVPKLSGRFAGRIFKRLSTTGHLLLTHYLSTDHNILKDPSVIRHSKLSSYLLGADARQLQEVTHRRRVHIEKEARKIGITPVRGEDGVLVEHQPEAGPSNSPPTPTSERLIASHVDEPQLS